MKSSGKSVIIDRDIHTKFKSFCQTKGYKMGKILENLISSFLDKK